MKGSLTNENKGQRNRGERSKDTDLGKEIPDITTEEKLRRYIKKKMPQWIKDIRKLYRGRERNGE